ncbi:MAG: beta-glucosidase BglX [Maricaulaceae bacterium]
MAEKPDAPIVNRDASVERKIDALIAKMTLEEKAGQLTQFADPGDVTGPVLEGEQANKKMKLVRSGVVGSVLNVIGVEKVRALQKVAVEDSRLGIPLIFAYDVIHGQKTMFPIPLAEAASWDLELIEASARVAAVEASAQGLNWTFAPMIDISRDPRWGRVMEGAGEDPFLGGEVAIARVRGFQGDDLSADNTIVATLKHFAGYGFAESGKDYNAADVGTVTLYNTILAPFRAAIERADARTVMNSFNTLNNVPATGDAFLQRDVLKGEWGFDGFIVSDWGSGIEMVEHGFAVDARDAARLSMIGGSDMDMESFIYAAHLPELVKSGTIEMDMVDDAVRRVLRIKFELGLFDNPYKYIDAEREAQLLFTPEHRAISRQVAESSIVLLKNEDAILPLQGTEKIALIGALANDKDTPLGNWRAQAEKGTAVSVREAFETAGLNAEYAIGAPIETGEANFLTEVNVNFTDKSGFDEAVEVAKRSDKVIIVLGEDAFQSGEGRSRAKLGFPGLQQELLEQVYAANPNTVLVVMSGRPLVLTWADENVPAIVQAWHLGHESGDAIVSVLTGEVNPSGKLPMTFPRSLGQIPIYYNHLNTGRPGPKDVVFWAHYTDESNKPLYPFGYGLSYTEFEYSDISVVDSPNGVKVMVRVENTGKRAGSEVVQLYIHDKVATISRPEKTLKAFEKINIGAGASLTVIFELTDKDLGFYNSQGKFVTEAGAFDVFVGGSSDAKLTETFSYEGQAN